MNLKAGSPCAASYHAGSGGGGHTQAAPPPGLFLFRSQGKMGYTKLDEQLVQSSIMSTDPNTFKIFITLLASCRPDCIAHVSSTFLAAACYMPIEAVDHSLAILEAPDNRSRSAEDDGRRIRRVDGGYFIINYSKYRDHNYSGKPEAVRKREYRKKIRVGHVPDKLGQIGTPASAYASAFDKQTIIDCLTRWNSFAELHGLVKITEIEKGSSREVHLRKLAAKKGFNFDSLLEIIGRSPFLLGQTEPKSGGVRFFATFDWIINKTNYQKVIEGNYLDRTPEDEKPGAWIKMMERKEKEEKERREKLEGKNGKNDQEDF